MRGFVHKCVPTIPIADEICDGATADDQGQPAMRSLCDDDGDSRRKIGQGEKAAAELEDDRMISRAA